MHFAHAVNAPGVEEHPFGRGGLTGVNMGNDADIAVFLYPGIDVPCAKYLVPQPTYVLL